MNTEEQTKRIRQTVAEFQKQAAEDPKFHEEALQKLAGPFGVMLPETLKMIAATAALTGTAAAAGDIYRTAKDAISKTRNYKTMIDANPDLQSMDAQSVQRAFNTLHNFNPHYAADPMVAGDYVKNQVTQQGIDYNRLKNVIDAGRAMGSNRPAPIDYLTNPATISQMIQFEHSSPYARSRADEADRAAKNERAEQLHRATLAREKAERRAQEARAAAYAGNFGAQ